MKLRYVSTPAKASWTICWKSVASHVMAVLVLDECGLRSLLFLFLLAPALRLWSVLCLNVGVQGYMK